MPYTCEKCNKNVIELICSTCKEESNTWIQKIPSWLRLPLEQVFIPVIVSVVTGHLYPRVKTGQMKQLFGSHQPR